MRTVPPPPAAPAAPRVGSLTALRSPSLCRWSQRRLCRWCFTAGTCRRWTASRQRALRVRWRGRRLRHEGLQPLDDLGGVGPRRDVRVDAVLQQALDLGRALCVSHRAKVAPHGWEFRDDLRGSVETAGRGLEQPMAQRVAAQQASDPRRQGGRGVETCTGCRARVWPDGDCGFTVYHLIRQLARQQSTDSSIAGGEWEGEPHLPQHHAEGEGVHFRRALAAHQQLGSGWNCTQGQTSAAIRNHPDDTLKTQSKSLNAEKGKKNTV